MNRKYVGLGNLVAVFRCVGRLSAFMGGGMAVPTCSFFSSASQTSKKYLAKSALESGIPLIRILSRTATRWGDVNRPTIILIRDCLC